VLTEIRDPAVFLEQLDGEKMTTDGLSARLVMLCHALSNTTRRVSLVDKNLNEVKYCYQRIVEEFSPGP